MKTWKQLLPVLAILLFTMMVSFFMYQKVLDYEQEKCWQELSGTAQTVKKEIATKFQDEITKLHLMQEIIINNKMFSAEDIEDLYLDIVQPTTIFTRIDILYPDNTIVSNGTTRIIDETLDFDEIIKDGEHMSRRKTDFITGKQYIYYVLPIVSEEQEQAVLIAALDTAQLPEIFQPIIYDVEADVCIVDAMDGNYIMDSWHEVLGNAYEEEDRKMLSGYEGVDAKEALKTMQSGSVAFFSNTTKKPIYLYFTPMEMFDWQLSIFAQEEVLFANMIHLRKIFLLASVAEVILLMLYFLIHFKNVKQLEKSYQQIQLQKEELVRLSYTDQLTSLYNRNKFEQIMHEYEEQPPQTVGVAYLDLNGLKQRNDAEGHEAGDRYLCQFAAIVSEIFGKNVYRIGGDEFVILELQVEENVFRDKRKVLLEAFRAEKISVSAGFFWESSCQEFSTALKQAEAQMYREKEAFYATGGKR